MFVFRYNVKNLVLKCIPVSALPLPPTNPFATSLVHNIQYNPQELRKDGGMIDNPQVLRKDSVSTVYK